MRVYCLEIFYNDIRRGDSAEYIYGKQKAFEKAKYEESMMKTGEKRIGEVYLTSGEVDNDGYYIMDKVEYLNREVKRCLQNI